jgi:hypothetical protein
MSDKYLERAATAWCYPETETIEIDSRLATAFAKILKAEHEAASKWISLDEFNKSPTKLCWIIYKDKVHLSRYFNGRFNFYGEGVFMTECVSSLMPITPPEGKDDE